MFNKHLLKVIIAFCGMIILGLAINFTLGLINSKDNKEKIVKTASPSINNIPTTNTNK